MHSINLINYTLEGLLATQLATGKIFDAIVYVDIQNPDIEGEQYADIYDLHDMQMSFGIGGKLQTILDSHKNTLIILSQYSIVYLLPCMTRNTENMVILNCGAGIS